MSELTDEMIDAYFAKNLSGNRDEPQEAEATPDDLRALYALMNVKHTFHPGDIVRLKKGLQGYKAAPDYGQPCVVMLESAPMPLFAGSVPAQSAFLRFAFRRECWRTARPYASAQAGGVVRHP